MRILRSIRAALQRLAELERRSRQLQEALGRIESRQLARGGALTPAEREFRVFSQWGEDGLVDWLTTAVPIERRVFVEFGVQDYTEANTRFLLVHKNWSGLVLDSDEANVRAIQSRDTYWRHDLRASAAFVTAENIDSLLEGQGLRGDIGLLSIDIDGNDYWVWRAISVISPRIVVVEYNSRLGPERAVTIPYRADFRRNAAHHSMLYYGASLAALARLGREKGYALVCCNQAGNNAFFVRADVLPASVQEADPARAFVRGRFRESRDERGELDYKSAAAEEELLRRLPWVEV
jgi:hypothetical protein